MCASGICVRCCTYVCACVCTYSTCVRAYVYIQYVCMRTYVCATCVRVYVMYSSMCCVVRACVLAVFTVCACHGVVCLNVICCCVLSLCERRERVVFFSSLQNQTCKEPNQINQKDSVVFLSFPLFLHLVLQTPWSSLPSIRQIGQTTLFPHLAFR